MSGETEKQVSGWTVDTLKESIENEIKSVRDQIKEGDRRYEQRFDAQEKATAVAIASAKEAVTKAEGATEKRFDSVNEFRAALSDQSKTLLSRPEYDTAHKALEDKLSALTDRINISEGRGNGLNAGWGYIIGFIGVVATIITVLTRFIK